MKGEIVTSANRLIVLDEIIQAKFTPRTYDAATSAWEPQRLQISFQKNCDILTLELLDLEAAEVWVYLKGVGNSITSDRAVATGILDQSTLVDRVKLSMLNPAGTSLF